MSFTFALEPFAANRSIRRFSYPRTNALALSRQYVDQPLPVYDIFVTWSTKPACHLGKTSQKRYQIDRQRLTNSVVACVSVWGRWIVSYLISWAGPEIRWTEFPSRTPRGGCLGPTEKLTYWTHLAENLHSGWWRTRHVTGSFTFLSSVSSSRYREKTFYRAESASIAPRVVPLWSREPHLSNGSSHDSRESLRKIL